MPSSNWELQRRLFIVVSNGIEGRDESVSRRRLLAHFLPARGGGAAAGGSLAAPCRRHQSATSSDRAGGEGGGGAAAFSTSSHDPLPEAPHSVTHSLTGEPGEDRRRGGGHTLM